MAPPPTVQIAPMRTDRDVRDASMLLHAHWTWSRSIGLEPIAARMGGVADYADPASYYSGPEATLLLADVEGRRVGMVGLRRVRDRPGVAELRRLFVLGLLRGQGVGGVLLDAAIAHSLDQGLTRLELRTRPQVMRRAYTLYRRAGFRDADAIDYTARFDVAAMTLDLAELAVRSSERLFQCS
ncbi:MAG TPA: GNAT family N-acetyltransferase [Nocardioidaceae bacterium]|nr:GNAT family N-acetyltransferase [Nocardioidaceae bacterium]